MLKHTWKKEDQVWTLGLCDPSLEYYWSIFFWHLSLQGCSSTCTFLQGLWLGLLWVCAILSKDSGSGLILTMISVGNIIIWINAHTPKPIKNVVFPPGWLGLQVSSLALQADSFLTNNLLMTLLCMSGPYWFFFLSYSSSLGSYS